MRAEFNDLPTFSDHVLVDGAFDPLHAGHLAYLTAASQYGPLLCAVASDDQIRAKGKIPLLPQDQRVAVMEALWIVSAVYAKDRPTEAILEQLRPHAYVKGADWKGHLPSEQIDVCARYEIPIRIVDTPAESSTARLKAWALADADQSLDNLERTIAAQVPTPFQEFNREYFQAHWRQHIYTLDERRTIEGRHPKILKELFDGYQVLDVGCGPGFLVQLLRELGMEVGGIDPSLAAIEMAPHGAPVLYGTVNELPDKMCDVAISREVLEHMPVAQIEPMVRDLFRIARKAVYITTRFSADSIFDVADDRDTDPTHITLLSQPFLRSLCVLNGGTRRRDWETTLDHQKKGRVLAYEVH